MSDTAQVICAKCKVPIQAGAEIKPDTIVSCPVCGISDTAENAFGEAADHKFQQTAGALERQFESVARRSKHLKFTPGVREKRIYRFIFDS